MMVNSSRTMLMPPLRSTLRSWRIAFLFSQRVHLRPLL